MEKLGFYWTDFHEIWYSCICKKCAEKIEVSVNLIRITRTLHEDKYRFMINRAQVSLELEMFQTKIPSGRSPSLLYGQTLQG